VPLIIHYATDYSVFPVSIPPLMALFMSLICYSFYIYLDFSGYSDIAIGTAYLIGIKTPENFNNPYRSQNLSEFWKRWHITFSSFLQLYVFKPFIQLFNILLPSKHRLLITILSYLATFVICGLWHGATINFVYWGLWHGVGLSINKIWLIKMKLFF
jgi:D-alanyl-lipoteichoic acid acyltransferase DltB (MBOAT superfamily)